MNRLYAVKKDQKGARQEAREAIERFRQPERPPITNVHDGEEGKRAPILPEGDQSQRKMQEGHIGKE
jgi:hypothetical protein